MIKNQKKNDRKYETHKFLNITLQLIDGHRNGIYSLLSPADARGSADIIQRMRRISLLVRQT